MSKELYKKYRPKTLSEVIGQEQTTKSLQKMIEQKTLPHTILLAGHKGSGKTTIGRILRKALKCSKWDFVEQNCANKRGIDSIREIDRDMNLAPMNGKTKVWLFDEAHQWTGESQDALLKILEDTPSHVYFILCTTDPNKLKATVRSRCTEFPIDSLNSKSLRKILKNVCTEEKREISEEVEDKIIENSDGSARNALVILGKVLNLSNEDDQLEAIRKVSTESAAIEIARTLFNPRAKWTDMSKILKEAKNEEPESVRNLILSYANSVLLGGGKQADRAFEVIQVFRDNWYDCKYSGLSSCCYEIMTGK